MEYILIDNFNGNINIVTDPNGSGDTLIFDNLEEVEGALESLCQDGTIVPLAPGRLYTEDEMLAACKQSLGVEDEPLHGCPFDEDLQRQIGAY